MFRKSRLCGTKIDRRRTQPSYHDIRNYGNLPRKTFGLNQGKKRLYYQSWCQIFTWQKIK